MLEAARPRLLLTKQQLRGVLPEWRVPFVLLDALREEIERSEAESDVRPDGVAFIVYERGTDSAGAASAHAHQALVNGLLWMRHAMRLSEADRVLHKAVPGTWPAAWELLAPLTAGAAVVVAEPGRETDCVYLASLAREHLHRRAGLPGSRQDRV